MSHILIIEDDADTRTTLAALIEARGYKVVAAEDGADALRKLSSNGVPCLIILDLVLPGMTGWQLRVELLAHADLVKVPVVLFSGLVDVERHAKILGAVDYLAKPFEVEELYRILDSRCRNV